jgi:hypothetical protein
MGRKRRTVKEPRKLRGQRRLPLGVPENHSVRTEYRRCGKLTCTTCSGGHGHGPYLYAVWRDGKAVKKKYLGPAQGRRS